MASMMDAAMWAAVGLAAVAAALVAGSWWRGVLRRRAVLSKLPSPPEPSLLTGHLPTLLSDRAPLAIAEWAAELGPVMRLRLLAYNLVIVADPALAAPFLRRGPSYLPKARQLYAALELGTEPRQANLLTADDREPLWRAVRNAVAPAFSATSLKQVMPRLTELTRATSANIDTAIERAGGGAAEVDVADAAKKITSDVMGTLLFGEDLKGVEGRLSEYMTIFYRLLEATHARFVNPLRPLAVLWSSDARAEVWALREHDRLMGEKVAALKKAPPPEFTIAGHVLRVTDPATGRPLSDARLKGEIGMIFGAGFETTSHAITWTLALLAAHPAAQARVAAELAAVGLAPSRERPEPRAYEWADGGRLPYLAAVVRESLRLFSPASLGSIREADRDIQIGGFDVPKGCMVMVAPAIIGLQPRLYGPDAREFRPERWLGAGSGSSSGGGKVEGKEESREDGSSGSSDGGGSPSGADVRAAPDRDQEGPGGGAGGGKGGGAALPPDAIPFSVGPRDCVGQALANLELMAVVATLVGRYEWADAAGASCAEDLLARCVYHVTLQPAGGRMPLMAKLRQAAV